MHKTSHNQTHPHHQFQSSIAIGIKACKSVALTVILLGASSLQAESPDVRVFDQKAKTDNIQYLMAAASDHSEGKLFLSRAYPKHFWLSDLNEGAALTWRVKLEQEAEYHVDVILEAKAGTGFTLAVAGSTKSLKFAKEQDGWDKQDCGVINLPAGVSNLTLTVDKKPGSEKETSSPSCSIKSLDMIMNADLPAHRKRIKNFKSDTTWFSKAKYGLMVQHGSWSYPQSGDRKPMEQAANDFDVIKFVKTIKDTGAGYLIYSLTWWEYKMQAPIKAVDRIIGNKDNTTERDLVGEIAKACQDQGIRFFLYYHIGQDRHRGINSTPWWKAQKFPNELYTKTGVADRSVCLNNWVDVVSEVGARYGKLLDGWFFDDGCCYYPAPFEAMGKAAKAGNPDRLIAYNPWRTARLTDFQNVVMGEDSRGQVERGSAKPGGDGVLTMGKHRGLLQHGMFTMERGWGIRSANQKAGKVVSAESLIKAIKDSSSRNVPVSINLVLWEGGIFNPPSLQNLQKLKEAMKTR
jgi:hypothetical protein